MDFEVDVGVTLALVAGWAGDDVTGTSGSVAAAMDFFVVG